MINDTKIYDNRKWLIKIYFSRIFRLLLTILYEFVRDTFTEPKIHPNMYIYMDETN